MKKIILTALVLAAVATGCTDNQREGWKKRFDKDGGEKSKQSAQINADKLAFDAEKQKLIGIETVSVKKEQIKDTAEFPAEIIADPDKAVSVIAPVSGQITSVYVNIGSRVEKDEVLAVIEDPRSLGQKFTARAPIKGVVSQRPASLFQWTESGKEIAQIVDPSAFVVIIKVYPGEDEKIAAGQDVYVESSGVQARAKINFISPVIDPATRTIEVRAKISTPNAKLKANAYATAQIVIGSKEALVAPQSALLGEDGSYAAYVNKGDSFEKRTVEVGIKYNGLAEITSGLSEGDIVVTKGAYQLKNAQFSTAQPADDDD